MTNFHVILTEECGDAPLTTYLFLLYMCAASFGASLAKQGKNVETLHLIVCRLSVLQCINSRQDQLLQ